ncbi:MAG TPA: nuclear transport factor 2 family protein [Ramlibacter sp.]|nr:nuclear transport factor 2 family protein [Ramlibacter sp.]
MQNTLTPEDRFAIKDLLARYGWALDTGDVDAFVDCFLPDGAMIEEVFEDPDVWEGRAGIRALAEHYRSIPNFPGRQHYAANVLVTPTGEGRAHVRSFALVTECQGEPPYKLRFCGYYEDEIVRLEGQWYFAKRVVRLWDGEVLKRFPGRGTFVPRTRPPEFKLVKKA